MTIRILLLSAITLILSCCSGKQHDHRLSRIEDIIAISPKEALDSLGTIDYARLSDADKHYYDFLSIKASDKAYITHTSDSLILKVIDYAQSHQDEGRYPEALYYGGRVYSDLGDYPTAIHYFQNALDLFLSTNSKDLNLKANIYSQYGRLLTSLRLYDDAIPYIESSIEIGKQMKDTANIIYDLQLLGGTYLRASNYEFAERAFNEALQLSKNQAPFHSAKSWMYLAAIKYRLEQIDSALYFIRNTPDKVKPTVRNSALGYAANIYLEAGILDTAYIYAREIICNPDSAPRETGYHVILSPKLRKFIPTDSLNQYISDYRNLLENFYDQNKTQLAINQQNLYNYQLHEREKAKAKKSNELLKSCVFAFLLIIILMALVILYFKNRNKAHIIELHEALTNITELRNQLNDVLKPSASDNKLEFPSGYKEKTDDTHTASLLPIFKTKEQGLRNQLKNELMALYKNASVSKEISPIILQSEVYQKLQELIANGKTIKEQNHLWIELEETILKCSPKFRVNLNLLTLGNLTTLELHTALLIKCGIKPSQMATLLGRSNGAIVSRRETLCVKVLDKKLGTKVIDSIIRLL